MKQSVVVAALIAASASMASADIVYETSSATNFYAPVDSSYPAGYLFGESGWFGQGSDAPVQLTDITLGLAVISDTPIAAGSTDINFTFNDGDPSALVYGTGQQLYATTIKNVLLPATDGIHATFFPLTIPLPGVTTLGGFNNVGWSVGVSNFNYDGVFGFQNSGTYNATGFFTEDESEYDPDSKLWSTYNFGDAYPADIANFVAIIDGVVPEPTSLTVVGAAATLISRRRRRA